MAAALLASGTGLAQAATGGGGSSSGGSGGGLLASASTVMIATDGFYGVGEPTLQGRGQASIDYFWNKTVTEFQTQLGRTPGTQGVQSGQTPRASFNAVCGDALQNAADRATAMGYPATAADSRVVGVYFSYATGTTNWFMSSVPSSEYSGNFAPSWDNEVNNSSAPGFTYNGDRAAYAGFQQDGVAALDAISGTWRSHVNGVIAANPSSGRYLTCVALNEFEPAVDFQPVVSSQVQVTALSKGETLTDTVSIGVEAGDSWTRNVDLRVRGTLYGPLSQAAATSATVPAGTPVASTAMLTFGGVGSQDHSWTATKSGVYAWVWEVRKADQGENAQYIREDARDAYFAPSETFTVRMSPQISTQVSAQYVSKGDALSDAVTVSLPTGDQWLSKGGVGVSVPAHGTLYGPLTNAQARSATVPADAPVAATGSLDFTSAGTLPFTWTATASGVYAWVWEIRREDGSNADYIAADVSDNYFAPSETFTVRMSPQLSTQVTNRYSDGSTNLAQDTVTVSLPAGDVWLADAAGNNLPLRTRVTAFGPYNTPTAAQAATPGSAPAVGTQFVTFTNVGTKTVPTIAQNGKGFYTYVAEILPADQSPAMQAVLSGAVRDWFMLEPETTSACYTVGHYSEVREYNVGVGGRAFDTITISGFPADHGTFPGLGGWQADVATATVTVYGPTASPITTAAVPAGTPVLKTITVPAKNGTYNIGYTTADIVSPNQPGHYVFVYSHAGGSRVQPFTSAANDVRERFYVPESGAPWSDMMSTATANAAAGTGVMSDTVLVTGNGVPASGTLVWQGCTWTDPSSPGCAQPVQTYTTAIAGSGFYNHPEIPVPGIADMPAGTLVMYYGWSVTLLDQNGVVLDREPFGVESQTTTIRAEIPDWSSAAPATAELGDAVSDVVTFDGPTRSDWTVQWSACWLDVDATCPDGESFTVGDPVQVDPASDTLTSPEWTVEVPANTKPGAVLRLGWQPVLYDGLGSELAREPWGTDTQVTTVTYPMPTMTSTATPSAMLGETTQDTVPIVGPLREGSRIIWAGCYWVETTDDVTEKDASRECRQDATPVADGPAGEDGSLGMVLPALVVGETLTVQSPEHELTYGGLLPDTGLRFTWTPRIVDVDGEVLVQEKTGLPAQTTTVRFPPIKVTTKAYSTNPLGPFYGDEIGDVAEVEGDILPGDTVAVALYAWETGTKPLCTGEPLATVELELNPSTSTYDTGVMYKTPADRANLVYGFQETTVSRGLTVVSECGLKAETLVMTIDPSWQWGDSASGELNTAAGELAITGVQRLGLLFGAALAMAVIGGQLLHIREKKRGKASA